MYVRGVGLFLARALVGLGALLFFSGGIVVYLFLSLFMPFSGPVWGPRPSLLDFLATTSPARDAFILGSEMLAAGLGLDLLGWSLTRYFRSLPRFLGPPPGRYGTAGEWVIGALP